MKLRTICEATRKNRPHQFRGPTSMGTDIDEYGEILVEEALGGEFEGRYFTYNDPRAGCEYAQGTLLVEVDIEPTDLVYENNRPISYLNDYQNIEDEVIRGHEDNPNKALELCVDELKSHHVPPSMIKEYVRLLQMKQELLDTSEETFGHYDGVSSREISEFSRKLSQYLLEDGAQVTLHHRPLLASELVAVYRVGFSDPELQRMADERLQIKLHNEKVAEAVGWRNASVSSPETRQKYLASAREGIDESAYWNYYNKVMPKTKFRIIKLFYNRGDANFKPGDLI